MDREYRADMHVHTTFSADAESTMEEMIKAAIEKQLYAVCFTEHFDGNPCDSGYGYYNHISYSKELERLRDKYSSELKILKGVEFGEPHIYKREFEQFIRYDYDYILASVHWIKDLFVGDMDITEHMPPERIAEIYYNEVRRAVEFGGFDTFAHIDYMKRGCCMDIYDRDVLESIMYLLVKNDIALEVNTQYLRRGGNTFFPDLTKIQMYRNAGGTKLVIGSDAHRTEDLWSDVRKAYNEAIAISGLKAGIFEKRKYVSL